jgi:hypothetical protein
MAGRYRLQIAVGGIGIGTGISAATLAFLVEAGVVTPIFPFIPSYAMLFISIVLIIGGILNLNSGAKMKERSTIDKQPEQDKTATS